MRRLDAWNRNLASLILGGLLLLGGTRAVEAGERSEDPRSVLRVADLQVLSKQVIQIQVVSRAWTGRGGMTLRTLHAIRVKGRFEYVNGPDGDAINFSQVYVYLHSVDTDTGESTVERPRLDDEGQWNGRLLVEDPDFSLRDLVVVVEDANTLEPVSEYRITEFAGFSPGVAVQGSTVPAFQGGEPDGIFGSMGTGGMSMGTGGMGTGQWLANPPLHDPAAQAEAERAREEELTRYLREEARRSEREGTHPKDSW